MRVHIFSDNDFNRLQYDINSWLKMQDDPGFEIKHITQSQGGEYQFETIICVWYDSHGD